MGDDLTGCIELLTGGFLDFQNPDSSVIQLEDVAHGLSQVCRYAGQCEKFYSVAEHAVLVSMRLQQLEYPLSLQWMGLHHDDAEAFIGDITRPLKELLKPRIVEIELGIWEAINTALNLQIEPPQPNAVKEADNWALSFEAYVLLGSRGLNWFSAGLFDPRELNGQEPAKLGLMPFAAKELWLDRYYELKERKRNGER